MAIPIIVEDSSLDLIIKVTKATCGSNSARNVALIYTLFGTGMMPSEIALLRISDYLDKKGRREKSEIRADISFNGRSRPLYWTNKKLYQSIDAYLEQRGRRKELSHSAPLFVSTGENGFSLRKIERKGKIYYSSASLVNLLNKLISGAGIEGASTGSARRTLAVKLRRKKFDYRTIGEILGQSSITATKKLCQGDSQKMGNLVLDVI